MQSNAKIAIPLYSSFAHPNETYCIFVLLLFTDFMTAIIGDDRTDGAPYCYCIRLLVRRRKCDNFNALIRYSIRSGECLLNSTGKSMITQTSNGDDYNRKIFITVEWYMFN